MVDESNTTSGGSAGNNEELVATVVSKIPILGDPIATMIRQKRWRLLSALVLSIALFVVYPLFVPYMAAVLINSGILGGLAVPYAATVDQALKVKDSATAVMKTFNERLDYFQMVDLYSNASESLDYKIAATPYQRIRIRSFSATLSSSDKGCPIPSVFLRQGATLYTIMLGTTEVGTLRNDGDESTMEITKAQWDLIAPHMNGDELDFELTPVRELATIECAGLKASIRMSVEVFKDLVPEPVP